MDEKLSQSTAQRLLSAGSSEDVAAILQDEDLRYYFDQPENWKPYGGRDKNWDTVGNQQSSPVGALTELITNGIDAILMRMSNSVQYFPLISVQNFPLYRFSEGCFCDA